MAGYPRWHEAQLRPLRNSHQSPACWQAGSWLHIQSQAAGIVLCVLGKGNMVSPEALQGCTTGCGRAWLLALVVAGALG